MDSPTTLFGTDGIRGEANQEPLTPETVLEVGRALSRFLREEEPERKVLLGHDGRRSGDLLMSALSAGFLSTGTSVVRIGLCSTPALAYLTREYPLSGGVMVSASHNPFYDNGIKPFRSTGEKLRDDHEGRIEGYLTENPGTADRRAYRDEIGRITRRSAWVSHYLEALSRDREPTSLHVVVDCANGGTSPLAPPVLEAVCDDLTLIHDDPDGLNINDQAGSLHTESLVETVRETGADVGFAFDGDGDRVTAVDHRGDVVDGDVLLYLLANDFAAKDALPDDGVVITTMSNLGLRRALESEGVQYDVVGVGDRHVYRSMQEHGWRLGGEQSGHIIDREWLPTGDGLNTVLAVLEALEAGDRDLSEWSDRLDLFPQVLHNVEVPSKPSLDSLSSTRERIRDIERELGDQGRIFVRYSGTEPVARIMLEGINEESLREFAEDLGDLMQREIREETVSSG